MTIEDKNPTNWESNEEIVQKYLNRYSHSKDSYNGRKYALQYFFQQRYFGYSKHIFELQQKDLIDYFDYLNNLDTVCLTTKLNKWTVIRSFLQFLMEYFHHLGFIVVIPRYSVHWRTVHPEPKKTNKDIILTKREIQLLLHYVKTWKYQYYLIFRLFAETGMRLGEFHSINEQDLDVEKRMVKTVGKTGRNVYYFSPGLARHLALYLKERELKDYNSKALFVSPLRKRVTKRAVNDYLHKCTERLEFQKRVSSHTFRRTLNTFRKKMGCPKENRKILLCHKVADVNYRCYVKLNYQDYINLRDIWDPYKNLQL